MGTEYLKVSDSVIKVLSTETSESSYTYETLLGQKTQIENDLARVQKSLDEINALIAKAKELGIVALPEALIQPEIRS